MKIYLAPMEGVVDHHLRYLLTRVGGIDLCVTEFIRVTDHVLPTRVFTRYCPELPAAANSTPIVAKCPTRVQLLGSNATAIAANAVKAAELGAPAIDLNFGCPAKTVNKNRGGACLLNEPETLYQIVSTARAALPEDIPLTAKIRLGYETRDRHVENARAIYEAGAHELVIHARSKEDGYQPPAYWETIAEVKAEVPIPLIANGEIWSIEDYRRCNAVSGCDNVMLGRGLLARPDLALAIKADCAGEKAPPLPWHRVAALLLEYFEMTSAAYPQKYLGNRTKQWLFYLQRQYPNAVRLFEEIKRQRDYSSIYSALARHALGGHNSEVTAAPELNVHH